MESQASERDKMMKDFLQLQDKTIVVFGVANKKSIAYQAATLLEEAGAKILYLVKDENVKQSLGKLLPEREILVCNVENESEIEGFEAYLRQGNRVIDGFLHSIAFANYSEGLRPFHETKTADFLQATNISCFSLTRLCGVMKPFFSDRASIVTMSISTTTMASENYGYMAPIKAALDSSVVFLAKSLGDHTHIRVNSLGASLLKTSASAGIPGYIDSYLYAEKVIPRHESLKTEEVAKTVLFLLSDLSSGITAQKIVVDAGMSINYFDKALIEAVNRK